MEDEVTAGKGVNMVELYLPVHVPNVSPCGRALRAMQNALFTNVTWARRMVDSWGKNNDGLLFGYRNLIGSFDECIRTSNMDEPNFSGKYCTIVLTNEISTNVKSWRTGGLFEYGEGPAPMWKQSGGGRTASIIINNKFGHMQYSTCMPSVCTAEQLKDSVNYAVEKSNVSVTINSCQVHDPKLEFTPADITFICVVSVLLMLVFLATMLDLLTHYSGNSTFATGGQRGILKFLLPFSAYTNMAKIFHINTTSPPSNITCLHGVRVLSMTWVIYAHQQTATMIDVINAETGIQRTRNLASQVLYNAYICVDSFFLVSGLLLSYSLLKQLQKNKRLNIFIFYIHRIIRLVPPVALVVGLYATVVRFNVSGPYADSWTTFYQSCQINWWKDVLLVNNFLNESGECMFQTWYIAVDCQFYLVAPLLILPLFRYKLAGQVWLYIITVASVIIPAAIIYAYNLPPLSIPTDPGYVEYFSKVYYMPWCRAGPWLVGIWLGYIFHNFGTRRPKISPIYVACGWTIATLTGFLVVFGMWSYNTIPPRQHYDIITQVVYGGLHRTAWAAALAWVVFACHCGYGGMVNGFLSHPVWQPLSRLTYSIFLVALNLQYVIVSNASIPYYYTHLNKVMETAGALAIAIPVALLVSLLVEAPVIGIEKLLLPGPKKSNKMRNESQRMSSILQNEPSVSREVC